MFSDDHDANATCVPQPGTTARAIVDADHPKTRSGVKKIRRWAAKLLPDPGPAIDGACRASAIALMKTELGEFGSRLAA